MKIIPFIYVHFKLKNARKINKKQKTTKTRCVFIRGGLIYGVIGYMLYSSFYPQREFWGDPVAEKYRSSTGHHSAPHCEALSLVLGKNFDVGRS